MSLLHEALNNIREKGIKAEEARRLLQEQDRLYSQLRSDSRHLLNTYGSVTPEPSSYKGILGIAKSFWLDPIFVTYGKELVTTLTDSEEEAVEVRITSEFKDPLKSTITICVQGIETFLNLPRNGVPFIYTLDKNHGSSASLEDLRRYKEVTDRVKEKFEPPTQTYQPH